MTGVDRSRNFPEHPRQTLISLNLIVSTNYYKLDAVTVSVRRKEYCLSHVKCYFQLEENSNQLTLQYGGSEMHPDTGGLY